MNEIPTAFAITSTFSRKHCVLADEETSLRSQFISLVQTGYMTVIWPTIQLVHNDTDPDVIYMDVRGLAFIHNIK